ncbi:MAG: hypothetical protein ACR2QK_07910 [Acidimicrobiales bacterium]
MALVDDGTIVMADKKEKKVFLVAAFRSDEAAGGPVTGTAEDVVAVIGMAGDQQRFEWVGPNQEESIANPALVTPVKVRLALPSPWHPENDGIVTGLVQLDSAQLGEGTVDDDIDHLLIELAKSRDHGPTSAGSAGG